MNNNYSSIQNLLHQKADCQARLNLLPYDGNPEIKERDGRKYLYVRKRVGSRLSSTYAGIYSDELYLVRNAREAREIRRNIRRLDKELALLGYSDRGLTPKVQLNLDFARINIKSSIFDQAILEGVATSFSQVEDIIEDNTVSGMTASDVQKILNLKHAWEFILDKDVIAYPSDYSILCHIAKLVNEGFFQDGGRIRGVPVTIGGSNYIPPMPIESVVKENIQAILQADIPSDEKAIKLCLYCMKAQIFNDGNKRAAIIFANHYLISQGGGIIIVPEKNVPQFKTLLIAYYEDRDKGEITEFMKKQCIKTF
ncbi:MAG TPA: Fic family protein [Clostridia bacterium]|nr:Fic family protein [Clostridia bacterium]